MKTSPVSNKPASPVVRRGFSLLELLLTMAAISCVAAAGYLGFSGTAEAARAGKLQSDVATINGAIRTYLVNGGRLAPHASAEEVLARLKTTSDQHSSARLAGLRGTMLDARLRGIPAAEGGVERAVWNPVKQRFEIRTEGYGFSAFDLGGDPTAPPVEESRSRTMDLATAGNWIWDHTGTSHTVPVRQEVQTTGVAQIEPADPATVRRLLAPQVSLPGAIYEFRSFNPGLPVTLTDPNPPGTARILYSVDNGPWQVYGGTPLNIPPQLTTRVHTYATAVDSENYEDSELRSETYETIYFTGTSAGNFHTPAGDDGLVTNLPAAGRSPLFKWGTPSGSDNDRQNELSFTGASFVRVAPDEEFKLGTLTYFNGTTVSGTNATTVQIAIDLNLTTPGVRESLNFTFKLLSTKNHGSDADEDADFVWIPVVSTGFRTTVKGKQFALILRFGEHSADGFTTIDTFHAHEGKSLTGTIYGRLSEVTAAP